MKIELSKTKFYYLTCNNEKRKKHMQEEFKDYDLTEVNPVSIKIGISKEQSGSTGFSRMMDAAVKDMDRTKPFQPFALIEDDIKMYREFPKEFEIPDDADLLYIGLSTWAMTDAEAGSPGTVCCSALSSYPDLVKLHNMLSTHGFMVCSIMGLISLQKCMFEDFYKKRGYDMTLAHVHPYINSYALRKPLVYQYQPMGGQEFATKYEITQNSPYIQFVRDLPKQWVNTTNMTNRTKVESPIPRRVLHFGAAGCKYLSEYINIGVKYTNVVWLDKDQKEVDSIKSKFKDKVSVFLLDDLPGLMEENKDAFSLGEVDIIVSSSTEYKEDIAEFLKTNAAMLPKSVVVKYI